MCKERNRKKVIQKRELRRERRKERKQDIKEEK
jgi:hypothetical protein